MMEKGRSVRKLYLERLVNVGQISVEDGEALLDEFRHTLERAFAETREGARATMLPTQGAVEVPEVSTAVPAETLEGVLGFITMPPAGFTIHPKLVRMMEDRSASLRSGFVDWATAEALAIGSLALEGVPVRLAGEDSKRGTFSQRHAELTDFETGMKWTPLQLLTPTRVRIVDSLLSEFAAVGFEYGYSIEWPEALVMWEAQFGDFANGAQVIIDQFIAAGEAKWGQESGLTLLLPHGYEGQGPDHSSGRIERFLELCAHDNIGVVVPATSGQYFHLLRRQGLARPHKPLIVFTPKSLLRTKVSFTAASGLSEGGFETVIDDRGIPAGARRLVLCSGKLFWDIAKRKPEAPGDVALCGLAQLYPVPEAELANLAGRHPSAELVWAQEEPENMGAYRFLWHHLRRIFGREPVYVGRPAAASPAVGSSRLHQVEQAAIVAAALGI